MDALPLDFGERERERERLQATIDVQSLFARYTLDSIGEIGFGVEFGADAAGFGDEIGFDFGEIAEAQRRPRQNTLRVERASSRALQQ